MPQPNTSSPPHAAFLDATPTADGLYDVAVEVEGECLGEVSGVAFAAGTGSHLYGTDHGESDFDLEGVFLESLEAIILGRDRSRVRFGSGDSPTTPNAAGDVDVEFVELRTFLRDALDGHPWAVELAFVPERLELIRTDLWKQLRQGRDRLISARVDPFVGYCRAQARRYGPKAERLTAVEEMLDVLSSADRRAPLRSAVDDVATGSDHVEIVELPIRNRDEPVELLRVATKKYELEAPVAKAVDSLESLRDRYGERVRNLEDGVDWKAITHAYRIAFELRELLATGELAFPLDRADFLGRVRRGELDYDRVERELPKLVEDAVDTDTDLPDAPDESFWENWLVETYTRR